MKKILLIAVAILISSLSEAKTIEKTFFYQNFQIEQQGDYYLITAPDALNTALNGQPLLPWYAAKVLLPPGEIIESVEFSGRDIKEITGTFQLQPKQYARPISKGESGVFVKDEEFYQSDSPYPLSNINKGNTEFWGGHGIGFINYTPFIYHAKSGKISYYQQVTIIIHTKPAEEAKQAMQLLNTRSIVQNQIKKFVDNPEAIQSYSQTSERNNDYDMIIITPEQFAEAFDTLVSHYLIRGLKVHVKTKEEILSEMSGQDAQEKIRNYIIQEYAAHGVFYVMLGGDVEHIPYRGFYCSVQSSTVYEDDNIPSDLYYSALDGNWNTDGDSKWGEIGEDDLLPEIAVARFSFSNTTELNSMLHKTISYQSAPVLGNLAHPLMVGEHLYDNPQTWGSQYLELLLGYHDDNGYETTGIPEDNTFTKLYEVNANWSSSQLMAEINSGKSFLHHVGHANETYVMKFSNSDITNSNFSGANGIDHQYTNVYTHGCICGSFDASDCIAEHMVKIDNFAAAFVGNSRYGWFNEGQTEGPSAHIHREFIDALYTDSLHRIGAAHMESKYATAPWVNASGQHEEGALRWCFYDCNVLGDPAMSIWTAEPWDITVNYPTAIAIGENNFQVDISSGGNPVEGLRAALIMNGELFGTELSDAGGHCVITLDPAFTEPGIAKLYVSGFNCVPHQYDVEVIPAEGAYIILNLCEIDDEAGNNNQMLDYGETINFNISLENVGLDVAEDVIAELSCSNPNIVINNAVANFGIIEGNSTETLNAAFNITISNDVEDNTQVQFGLNITSGTNLWENNFVLDVLAPNIQISGFNLSDINGNNNGRLDPGETVTLLINIANTGSSLSPEIVSHLNSSDSFISIGNPSQTADELVPNTQTVLSFNITVSEDALTSDTAHLSLNIAAGNYSAFMSYFLPIGIQIEDWESGTFSQYDWYSQANSSWILTASEPYQGNYCAQSGLIGDNQITDMNLDAYVLNNDSISFYYKVSSETNFDFLRFNIDGVEKERWSGEIGWSRAAFAVDEGDHTFSWFYTKDGSALSGQDKAWVDFIILPAMGLVSQTSDNTLSNFDLSFFPNPVKQIAQLSFINKEEQILTVQIIDQNGKIILNSKEKTYSKGKQNLSFNLSNLSSGTYTITLKNQKQISSVRFIKM